MAAQRNTGSEAVRQDLFQRATACFSSAERRAFTLPSSGRLAIQTGFQATTLGGKQLQSLIVHEKVVLMQAGDTFTERLSPALAKLTGKTFAEKKVSGEGGGVTVSADSTPSGATEVTVDPQGKGYGPYGSTKSSDSILFHELAHALQFITVGPPSPSQKTDEEKRARKLQEDYDREKAE